jgi:hypothetical protein
LQLKKREEYRITLLVRKATGGDLLAEIHLPYLCDGIFGLRPDHDPAIENADIASWSHLDCEVVHACVTKIRWLLLDRHRGKEVERESRTPVLDWKRHAGSVDIERECAASIRASVAVKVDEG